MPIPHAACCSLLAVGGLNRPARLLLRSDGLRRRSVPNHLVPGQQKQRAWALKDQSQAAER